MNLLFFRSDEFNEWYKYPSTGTLLLQFRGIDYLIVSGVFWIVCKTSVVVLLAPSHLPTRDSKPCSNPLYIQQRKTILLIVLLCSWEGCNRYDMIALNHFLASPILY